MKILARLVSVPLLLAAAFFYSGALAEEQADEPGFSDGEIRQLLAPIALYPDALLSQILIAATYPLEVVEAARWSRDHPDLKGQDAVEAVEDRDWDLSIKSLVAFPEVLARMNQDLDWTRRLGDAFLLQEEQVIAAIQDLRERAEAAGTLDELELARAYHDGDKIVIEPRDTRIVYVPYYSPRVVYGGWWWPAYPPYIWEPPVSISSAGFYYWGGAVVVSSGYFFSGFDWRHRHVVILNPYRDRFRYLDSPKWRHDPKHRRGVVYRQPALERQYRRGRSDADAGRMDDGDRRAGSAGQLHSRDHHDQRRSALRRLTTGDRDRSSSDHPGLDSRPATIRSTRDAVSSRSRNADSRSRSADRGRGSDRRSSGALRDSGRSDRGRSFSTERRSTFSGGSRSSSTRGFSTRSGGSGSRSPALGR